MSKTNEALAEGNELAGKERYEEAVARYQQGLRESPDHHELLYNQAKAFFKLKDFSKALANFDRILLNFPDSAEIISERAVLYHHLGDNARALEELNIAADLEPENPFRYSSRAWIKAALKDIEGAIADYTRAIELDPEDAISYNNRGLLEDQLGYKQAAKQSFDRSNELTGYQPGFDSSQKAKVQPSGEDTPVEEGQPTAAPDRKLTASEYGNTLKKIFTDKSERKQFFSFLRKIGK